MIDGANTVCSSEEAATALSATALARIRRPRLRVDAPSVEKKTKRCTPARSAACTSRQVATPDELLDGAVGLVADDRGQVHDGVHVAQRVAEGEVVAEVAERDLHPDAVGPQPARIADQAAHRGAGVDAAAAAAPARRFRWHR